MNAHERHRGGEDGELRAPLEPLPRFDRITIDERDAFEELGARRPEDVVGQRRIAFGAIDDAPARSAPGDDLGEERDPPNVAREHGHADERGAARGRPGERSADETAGGDDDAAANIAASRASSARRLDTRRAYTTSGKSAAPATTPRTVPIMSPPTRKSMVIVTRFSTSMPVTRNPSAPAVAPPVSERKKSEMLFAAAGVVFTIARATSVITTAVTTAMSSTAPQLEDTARPAAMKSGTVGATRERFSIIRPSRMAEVSAARARDRVKTGA